MRLLLIVCLLFFLFISKSHTSGTYKINIVFLLWPKINLINYEYSILISPKLKKVL